MIAMLNPMKAVTAICMAILASGVSAQPVVSSCDAPQEILDAYRDDADRITLDHTYAVESTWMDSVALDAELAQRFLDGIIAIYNAPGIPEVDTIFHMLDIHTFPYVHLKRVSVVTQVSNPWVQSVLDGIIPTGNSAIDDQLITYGMSFVSAWFNPNGVQVTLRFDTGFNVNTIRLAQQFQALPDVSNSFAGGLLGNGDEIEGEPVGDAVRLVFSHGWLCDVWFCVHRRYWEFVVEDCSVEFIGSYGSTLYPFTGLQENEHLTNGPSFLVHPNPASDILQVQHPEGLRGTTQWTLHDLAGGLIDHGLVGSHTWSLSMAGLSVGTYFLQVVDAQGKRTERIVKN